MPQQVIDRQKIRLGVYRGLRFGIVLHPQYRPELYLEGAITRHDTLYREQSGPRAILNAVERLADSYGRSCAATRQELALAETQLRDYQARLGAPFPHEDYLAKLSGLRDRLKFGLSGATPEPGTEPIATVLELAEQIKALKAEHSIEGTPERVGTRRSSAEEPVTSRIRRRGEGQPTLEVQTPEPTSEEMQPFVAPPAIQPHEDARAAAISPERIYRERGAHGR